MPTFLIGSVRCTLRLSSFRPRASLIAVAMSWAVTEPNRRPSAPACWGIVSTVRLSRLTFSSAFSIALRAARSAASWRWRIASTAPLRRRLGELARHQVVAQVALGDVDDVALLAERLDVLEEDRLGHPSSGRRGRRVRGAGCPRDRPRSRRAAARAHARA